MRDDHSPTFASVLGLFLLSGATGLVYEVLWSAQLGRVFGHAAHAAAATLLAFFLGLALGAWTWGRWSRRIQRPLRVYGWLEIGVAVAAGAALFLDHAHRAVYGVVVDAVGTEGLGLTLARLVLAVALIGPAAFLMGGTLPVLGAYVARQREALGRRTSLLYAANTVGAAGGAVLGGFVLPPWLGYRASYLVAMAATVAVGLLALGLARREVSVEQPPDAPVDPTPHDDAAPGWTTLRLLAFASGCLALALQVLWTRLLAQVLQNSVQAFALILAAYLLALGLAGGLAHVLARRPWAARTVLVVLLSIAGVLVAVSGTLYLAVATGGRFAPGASWGAYLVRAAAFATGVVGPPVLVLGAVFPYLWRAAERQPKPAGAVIGGLAGWNTLGAALGAVVAGFVLLPTAGVWLSLRLAAVGYALLALGLALRGREMAAKALAFTVVVATASAVWPLPAPARPRPGERLLRAWEGPSGTLAVFQRDDVVSMRFNDGFTLGNSEGAKLERLQTHVALGLHPTRETVFYLGLGTGCTAGGAMGHALRQVVVAEIVPEVVEASRDYFGDYTERLFTTPWVTIVADDGRHRLAWGDETYDVVVGDLFFPWEAGAADLFTREHFASVRNRLTPGGVFVQWLPCYQLSEHQLKAIARTMTDVFPLTTLWRGDFLARGPIVAVVGHDRPDPLDPEGLVGSARDLKERDAGGYGDHPSSMPFAFYAGNLTAGASLLMDAPLHTDDRPWLAWEAPREQRRREAGAAKPVTADVLLGLEEALAAAVPVGGDPYLRDLSPVQRGYVTAGLELRRISVHGVAGRRREAQAARKAWARLMPAPDRPALSAWTERRTE